MKLYNKFTSINDDINSFDEPLCPESYKSFITFLKKLPNIQTNIKKIWVDINYDNNLELEWSFPNGKTEILYFLQFQKNKYICQIYQYKKKETRKEFEIGEETKLYQMLDFIP